MKSAAIKMVHAMTGHTVSIFQGTKAGHWFADYSNESELEWVGGRKSALDLVWRLRRQGWQ
jgi:hypothetical protein